MCILLPHLLNRKRFAYAQDDYVEVQRLARDIEHHSQECPDCSVLIEKTDDVLTRLFLIAHTQENK